MNRGQAVVLGSLAGLLALATVRAIQTGPGLPSPSIYAGGGVLYSFWFLVAGFAPALGGTLAVGTLVTALLRPFLPGGSGNSPIAQAAQLLDQISGGNSAPKVPTSWQNEVAA